MQAEPSDASPCRVALSPGGASASASASASDSVSASASASASDSASDSDSDSGRAEVRSPVQRLIALDRLA
jgi:hypothetical protein